MPGAPFRRTGRADAGGWFLMQTELKLRIASGVVLAAVALAATWFGGLAFQLLSVLIALLVYYEWSTITRLAESPKHVVPGHDPSVVTRYPAARPGLEGMVVRLDVDPA